MAPVWSSSFKVLKASSKYILLYLALGLLGHMVDLTEICYTIRNKNLEWEVFGLHLKGGQRRSLLLFSCISKIIPNTIPTDYIAIIAKSKPCPRDFCCTPLVTEYENFHQRPPSLAKLEIMCFQLT